MTFGTGGRAPAFVKLWGMKPPSRPLVRLVLPLFAALALSADLFAAADLAPARLLLAQKDYAGAADALEKIVSAEPDHAEAWLDLGDALSARINHVGLALKVGVARRSLAAYEKAAALDPRGLRARLSLIGYYSKAPFFVGGDREKAYRLASELASIDAFHGQHSLLLLALEDKHPDEAFAAGEAILRLEPDSYRALCAFGRASAFTGCELARGAAALRRACALPPDRDGPAPARACVWLARICEQQGDRAAAIAACEETLRLDPAQKEARELLASLR